MNVPRPEELLGRPAQPTYGPQAQELVGGKRILVTGAAGSIGSELVRQLLRLRPERVFQLDIDEGRLHSLQLEIHGEAFRSGDEVVLSDIRDERGLDAVMESVRPHIIFHTAALKHLTLLERFPCEGVKTNVLGTDNVVRAAIRHGVERFINVSTDKAADPTSVLGATKRLAEMLVHQASPVDTKIASVRFGNVLGSRGSFYDTLAHQVAHGLPVTVTHPDVTRFLMAIPEAAGLVIEAGAMATAGELYVLDMGQPVRILSLVENFARLAGVMMPPVRITGLMPGEKLHEVLFSHGESDSLTAVPGVWKSEVPACAAQTREDLRVLYWAAAAGDSQATRKLLAQQFPGLASKRSPSARPLTLTPGLIAERAASTERVLVAGA